MIVRRPFSPFGVEAQDCENFVRLWAAKEFLEPGNVLEAVLQRVRALFGVGRVSLALQPVALLVGIEELAEALAALLADGGHRVLGGREKPLLASQPD